MHVSPPYPTLSPPPPSDTTRLIEMFFFFYQIVKVETRLSIPDQGGILVSKGEYVAAKSNNKNKDGGIGGIGGVGGGGGDGGEIMSSFRPSDNAKLYASPEDVKTVGFRSRPPVSEFIIQFLSFNRRLIN